ncbi:MAG: hypothetical protein MJ182_06630 [Treponema sp.]|nr:hypothetical protein [Treponema sp.]
MKCVKKALALAAALIFVTGCASNKVDSSSEVGTDSYEDSVLLDDDEVTDVDEVYQIDNGTRAESKKNAKAKGSGNFLQNIFGSKYMEIEDGSLFTSKTFGGIKQNACTYVVYPGTDTAGFGSNYMASYYYLTMDDANRKMLENCMQKYFKDFENKKLKRDDSKSYKAYGKIKVFLRWGAVKGNNPYFAKDVPVFVGYKFVDKSPYFTLTMNQSVPGNTHERIEDVNDVVFSAYLNYFFTKAQCNMLIEGLSDEKIAKVLNKYEIEETGEYQENDSY